MKIISIVNNKGGVGKTTITQNIGVSLAKQGLKTALIDFDAQANLSFSIKHTPNLDLKTLLLKRKPVSIREFSKTEYENLYLLPNKKDVNSSTFNNFNHGEQPFVFSDILKELKDFDYILIDTAPALDVPTFNAMIASDFVIVPVEYDIYSAIGLTVLHENITSAKRMNPNLDILGILPVQVDERMKINKAMQEPLEKNFGNKVFKNTIRTNVKFKQAQAEQKDIFSFEKNKGESRGSTDIENLTLEILNRIKSYEK